MADWRDYHDLFPGGDHTVVGTLKVLREIHSPQLNNWRDVYVHLPPSYYLPEASDRRYPVIYMHDGQNLFDVATSYVGEWDVDSTMQALSRENLEAIIVGVPNNGDRRLYEYCPFPSSFLEGDEQGDLYLSFIINSLKPVIDSDLRTLPDREHTGIIGSSMGGLISLYALFRHRRKFGFAGVMSPAFWFVDDNMFDFVDASPHASGRIYLDVGTAEMESIPREHRRPGVSSTRYVRDARRMNNLLLHKGYRAGRDLLYFEEPSAVHHERAWARRLPDALRFLLKDRVKNRSAS